MTCFQVKLTRGKPGQTAQGMVEFALVLPILLLILFGLFAFGHLLFSYTLVTAASREAARYGVATGLSDNGVARYRNCDEIRDAAVRVGSFAGVNYANVTIQYDKGLRADGSFEYHPDDCPIGGIGPGYIEVGDRIAVIIDVPYRPIVPLRIIPDMTLSGETHRTIIGSLPIDDVGVAEKSQCIGTITRFIPHTPNGPLESTSMLGKVINPPIAAQVVADDPTLEPPGMITMNWEGPLNSISASGPAPAVSFTGVPDEIGPYTIQVRYDPEPASPCFSASRGAPWLITIGPADTKISVVGFSPRRPTYKGDPRTITVQVEMKDPEIAPNGDRFTGPSPNGWVYLLEGDAILSRFRVSHHGPPGVSRGSGEFRLNSVGTHTLMMYYDQNMDSSEDFADDPNYTPSTSDPFTYTIDPALTVTSLIDPPERFVYPGTEVTITVQVRALDSRFDPDDLFGPVRVTDNGLFVDTIYVEEEAGNPVIASGFIRITLNDLGVHNLRFHYDPDDPGQNIDFAGSWADLGMEVIPFPTETPEITPTVEETEQVIETPDPMITPPGDEND